MKLNNHYKAIGIIIVVLLGMGTLTFSTYWISNSRATINSPSFPSNVPANYNLNGYGNKYIGNLNISGSNVLVSNLNVVCNSANSTGISLNGVSNVSFHNIEVSNCTKYGIYMNKVKNINIYSSNVGGVINSDNTTFGDGIYVFNSTNQVHIYNTYMGNSSRYNIEVVDYNVSNEELGGVWPVNITSNEPVTYSNGTLLTGLEGDSTTQNNNTLLQLTGSTPISLNHIITIQDNTFGIKNNGSNLTVTYLNNTDTGLPYNVSVYVNSNFIGNFSDTGESPLQNTTTTNTTVLILNSTLQTVNHTLSVQNNLYGIVNISADLIVNYLNNTENTSNVSVTLNGNLLGVLTNMNTTTSYTFSNIGGDLINNNAINTLSYQNSSDNIDESVNITESNLQYYYYIANSTTFANFSGDYLINNNANNITYTGNTTNITNTELQYYNITASNYTLNYPVLTTATTFGKSSTGATLTGGTSSSIITLYTTDKVTGNSIYMNYTRWNYTYYSNRGVAYDSETLNDNLSNTLVRNSNYTLTYGTNAFTVYGLSTALRNFTVSYRALGIGITGNWCNVCRF